MIAWERSRATSAYGIICGTQVKTNMTEFSAECHSLDCSGDRKVLTELQIAIRLRHCFRRSKIKRIEQNSNDVSAVYLYLSDEDNSVSRTDNFMYIFNGVTSPLVFSYRCVFCTISS